MYYIGVVNRKAIKMQAKEWIRRAVPAAWLVALVYQVAVTVIPEFIGRLMPYQNELNELFAMYSPEDAELILYRMMDIFSSTGGYLMLFVSIALSLYSTVVSYGYTGYSLGVIRGENPGCGELFSRFYMAGKIILAMVLEVIYVFLWSLLFVIPGLVAAYRYRMVTYCLLDDPDCSVNEAFRRSKLLMDGRKWELFKLDVSFWPWSFAASLLAGSPYQILSGRLADCLYYIIAIAINLFLIPYRGFTYASWYEAIRPKTGGEQEPQNQPYV